MHSQPLIVIVDDDLTFRKHYVQLLADEEYNLFTFSSGRELLAQLDDGLSPDLIILDVIMHDMDGLEVCRRIKRNPKWQHIPIILSTVLEAKQILIDGTEAGADDYLPKPINKVELYARVRSMLRIKRQYDELENVLKLREDLSNMIIHDMSSPVVAVQLHATLLRDSISDPARRQHLDHIMAAADRLDSFINDILMVAKMEQTKLYLHRSATDVNELILDMERQMGIMAHTKNIRLLLLLPDEPVIRSLDSNLFRRVISNLFANAIQYSPNAATVTVSLDALSNTNMRLKIMDEGPGVPLEDRMRIFNKYEITKLKATGIKQIGLGLTFSKMVVEAHGGSIYVTENQPKGAVFVVEL